MLLQGSIWVQVSLNVVMASTPILGPKIYGRKGFGGLGPLLVQRLIEPAQKPLYRGTLKDGFSCSG